MSEPVEVKDRVLTSIKINAENFAYLKESGNITQRVNELVEKYRKGEVVTKEELLAGKSSTACIMPLDFGKPSECWAKKEFPKMQNSAVGDLLVGSFCKTCPHYKRDWEQFRQQFKTQAKAIEQAGKPQPFKPKNPHEHVVAAGVTVRKCKYEGCPEMIYWRDDEKRFYQSSDAKPHYCQYSIRNQPPELQNPSASSPPTTSKPDEDNDKDSGRRVRCSDCGESFASYNQDTTTALDWLLDVLISHKSKAHQKTILSEQETQQFRMLRGNAA